MSVADIAHQIDQEIADRVAEVQRLAAAHAVLTGVTAPSLLGDATGGGIVEMVAELPAAPVPEVERVEPRAPVVRSAAPVAPAGPLAVTVSLADVRVKLIERLELGAELGEDGWVSPTDLFRGVPGSRGRQLKALSALIDDGLVEDNGRLKRGRRVRAASRRTAPDEVEPAPDEDEDDDPVVPEPAPPARTVSRRVQKELERAVAPVDQLEQVFFGDTTRVRIARQVLNACETELRHPAALGAELMHNKQEVAYVMRELLQNGLLVEHDGKYGKAA